MSHLNFTMNDGSRKFGELAQTVLWYELRDHIGTLRGATVTDFVTDGVTEAWIDFTFHGLQFTVNDQFGDYCFFVNDAQAPEEALEAVLFHCRRLLGSERKTAQLDGVA